MNNKKVYYFILLLLMIMICSNQSNAQEDVTLPTYFTVPIGEVLDLSEYELTTKNKERAIDIDTVLHWQQTEGNNEVINDTQFVSNKSGWYLECVENIENKHQQCLPVLVVDEYHHIEQYGDQNIYVEQKPVIVWAHDLKNDSSAVLADIVRSNMQFFLMDFIDENHQRTLNLEEIDSNSLNITSNYRDGDTWADLYVFSGETMIYETQITVFDERYRPEGEGWEILPVEDICPANRSYAPPYYGYGASYSDQGGFTNRENIGNPNACFMNTDGTWKYRLWLKEDITVLNPFNKSYLQFINIGSYNVPAEFYKSEIIDSRGPVGVSGLVNYGLRGFLNGNNSLYAATVDVDTIIPITSMRNKINFGYNVHTGNNAAGYALIENDQPYWISPVLYEQIDQYGSFKKGNKDVNIWRKNNGKRTEAMSVVKPFRKSPEKNSPVDYTFQTIASYDEISGLLVEENRVYNNTGETQKLAIMSGSRQMSTALTKKYNAIVSDDTRIGLSNSGHIISEFITLGMGKEKAINIKDDVAEGKQYPYKQYFDLDTVSDWVMYDAKYNEDASVVHKEIQELTGIYNTLSQGYGLFNPDIRFYNIMATSDIYLGPNNNFLFALSNVDHVDNESYINLKTSLMFGENDYFLNLLTTPRSISIYENERVSDNQEIEITTKNAKGQLLNGNNLDLYVNKKKVSEHNPSTITYNINIPEVPSQVGVNTEYYNFRTVQPGVNVANPSNEYTFPVSVYKFGAEMLGSHYVNPGAKIDKNYIENSLYKSYIKNISPAPQYRWVASSQCGIKEEKFTIVSNSIIQAPTQLGSYEACLRMEQTARNQVYNIVVPIEVVNSTQNNTILGFVNNHIQVSDDFNLKSRSMQNIELLKKSIPWAKTGNALLATYGEYYNYSTNSNKISEPKFEVRNIEFKDDRMSSGTADICYRKNVACDTLYFNYESSPEKPDEDNKWLPNYSKWLNAEENVIPKENAFMMMYSDDTEVVAWSEGINQANQDKEGDIKQAEKVVYPTDKGPQWVKWKNVGYYQGKPVDLKLTVSDFGKKSSSTRNNYIVLKGQNPFGVSISNTVKKASINYEFFNSNTGEPIAVTGYWNLRNIDDGKMISMDTKQIEHIYSISRDGQGINDMTCTTCTLLTYDIDNQNGNEKISITGHGHFKSDPVLEQPTGIQDKQLQTTFTYKEKTNIAFDIESITDSPFINAFVGYNSAGLVKVAIPDPEPLDQKVDQITPENRDHLTNEFIQYIPFEPQGKRDQKMSWELPKNTTIDMFKPGLWKIINEKGDDSTDLFNITAQDSGFKIEPKNITENKLYNHYYKFQYTLPFNEEKRVRKDQLDQNNYLTYEQVIDFKVNDEHAVQIKPKTDINMNAKVTYKYLDTTKNEISSEETKQELITDPYPITDAKYINQYAFKESIPNNLSQEKLKYTDNSVQFIYEEGLSWLPNYSKWLDADKNVIPKENAFMMMYSDDTEVVAWSEGIDKANEGDIKNAKELTYPVNEGSQWVKWKNVGYYQGTPVDLKMTVSNFGNTQLDTEDIKTSNTIYIRGNNSFGVTVAKIVQKVSVNYEFFNSNTGEPIAVTGYWNFSNLSDSKIVTIPTKQIENIYSISRDGKGINDMNCTTCTLLTYDLSNQKEEEVISITGHGHFATDTVSEKPPGIQTNQLSITFTYEDKTNIAFDIESTKNNIFNNSVVEYNSAGLVKVEIPNPEPLDQKVDQITPENRDHLTNEFIQYIPFEPKNKRDQKMEWQIPKNTTIDIFSPGSWKIINEKGVDSTDLFNITKQDSGFKIEPKDIKNSKLYNHYYKFQYKLLFDETKQVKDTELTDDNHLIYAQSVNFTVNQDEPIQIISKTDINMNATVNYKYIDERSQEVIQEISKKALITKTPPEAETLENYKLIKVDPIDYDSKPILYTEQYVSLYFLKNLFSIEVPDVLNFKTVDTLYKQSPIKDDKWPIEVTNSITDHWYVEVKQNTPLILKSTLKEICKGANSCFVYKTKDKELPLSMNTPIRLNSDEFKDNGTGDFVLIWGKDRESSLFFSGFKQKTTMGTYVSELEFNLSNAL